MFFGAVFYSSQQPSQIGPTADFDGAAIPPPIFSMDPIMNTNWTLGNLKEDTSQ